MPIMSIPRPQRAVRGNVACLLACTLLFRVRICFIKGRRKGKERNREIGNEREETNERVGQRRSPRLHANQSLGRILRRGGKQFARAITGRVG